MLGYLICILFVFVHFMFHFYEITSNLIIVRNAVIVLNSFWNELMGTKKIGYLKDGPVATISAHV